MDKYINGKWHGVCLHCGVDYIGHHKTQKFCSTRCASKHDYGKRRKGELTNKYCKYCNTEFLTYLKRQIFCSKKCNKNFYKSQNEKNHKSSLRWKILTRDNFRCQYCGRNAKDFNIVLHVDHIIPKSKGGLTNENNLITSCEDCNIGKGGIYFGELFTKGQSNENKL